MKLLIIEDDEAFARTLARRLQKHGFDCHIENNEENVLYSVESIDPDFVLLDMKLQTKSGLHFIESIKSFKASIKLVLLTGFASIATAVEAVKLGADDYLTKPADTLLIVQTLIGTKDVQKAHLEADSRMSAERLEWEHIQQVLKANHGNVSETARQLNMHRRTLQRKLQKKPVQK
ncbi:response regulator transcription factor [Pseudoalteromonas phenolica]|uniref:DNA-binding response regulator n=1 Tax=Pseudoalteromonas phenolica TaxID=161398 RepID=A0A0S2K873_9GAMM|nr:response regulator [Pseudoalteromonas phenolica]ALO44567.1 DNA-binding response regulator [Pseudoalteromonas phenolica]MBE0357598.1 two-component system, response regulator RegA [Pseudoalteromonas phenolica O-BC30]RXF02601.1 response regulator [Pseudoalteromonas phenolica O-BC30]TMO55611.1 DNA-binding response regulator [Pseudoalteromonas phenolica]